METLKAKMINFDRAMAYLNKLPNAISGAGGHDATLRAACECVRFGLTNSELRDAMDWYNANRCQPQWSAQELAHKITSAQAKAKQGERINMQTQYGGRARTFMPPKNKQIASTVKPSQKPGNFSARDWAQKMIADGADFTDDEMMTVSGAAAKEAWRKWAGTEDRASSAPDEDNYWDFVMEQSG